MAKYSEFTKNYRLSSNVEDRRFDRTQSRKTTGGTAGQSGGATSRRTPVPKYGTADENTPDDYSVGPAEGGGVSPTTPDRRAGQARKMDPEDAIDITSNRR